MEYNTIYYKIYAHGTFTLRSSSKEEMKLKQKKEKKFWKANHQKFASKDYYSRSDS